MSPTDRTPIPAHLSSKSDNWPTPLDFFKALDAEFGFVLDVCASTSNHKAPAYYALDHADETRRNGLAQDWAAEAARLGGAVWMNSPYGRPIASWMEKAFAAALAGATVVTLVPVRADTAWWHEYVLATGAEVRYVRGRLTFGDAKNSAAFASAVVIYRPTDTVGTPGPVGTMPAHPSAARRAQPEAGSSPSTPRPDLPSANEQPSPGVPGPTGTVTATVLRAAGRLGADPATPPAASHRDGGGPTDGRGRRTLSAPQAERATVSTARAPHASRGGPAGHELCRGRRGPWGGELDLGRVTTPRKRLRSAAGSGPTLS